MRLVKRISYFFVIPPVFLGLGVALGVWGMRFFYPGAFSPNPGRNNVISEQDNPGNSGLRVEKIADPEDGGTIEVSAGGETLCADTEYVLQETDILRNTTVETTWKVPHQYLGMSRERFLESMELYAAHPPLSELERGFVGLEVLSFSRERVVVRMDYRYVQPSESFYLAVRDHEVIVYLEDQTTVYISTGIALDTLPETVQLQIMEMLYVPDEETLYNLLETYSS